MVVADTLHQSLTLRVWLWLTPCSRCQAGARVQPQTGCNLPCTALAPCKPSAWIPPRPWSYLQSPALSLSPSPPLPPPPFLHETRSHVALAGLKLTTKAKDAIELLALLPSPPTTHGSSSPLLRRLPRAWPPGLVGSGAAQKQPPCHRSLWGSLYCSPESSLGIKQILKLARLSIRIP